MVTKLFRRADSRDVFELVDGPDDPLVDLDEDIETDCAPAPGAAEEESGGEEVDQGGASPPAKTRRWVRDLVVIGLTLVFVGLAGAAGFFGWQYKQQRDVAAAGEAALAAAQQFATALTSINTNAIDNDFQQVIAGSTGDFKDTYSQSAGQLRQVLIDNKAASKGSVTDAAIKSASKDQVDVLLFVDQQISNTARPEPREDRSRVAVTMKLVDGRWLASHVELK
ncbi:DUF3329 domain-containing protein [Mycolicibacterium sp. 050232]|uniref:DUF3329 domain-containing protein n=1 Tax=Mycolicibacterium sp. 050232 TaxID=3113982 RepID=UPI002E2BE000|nr:DUF3329 domain-containing protein [Mycolicibacterium sp. 050232]MED5810826.1 DUF3329 domain-containing protein [Mycolicibacterium sp. 050232]